MPGAQVNRSPFKPRGHYADHLQLQLQRYFRATMWLGRNDFRFIETLPDGTQVFRRRQLVVTAHSCEGPRAYVGVASAYHELVTGLDRLSDSDWAPMARTAKGVAWMEPILP